MAEVAYVLCALTSIACAVLLLRAHRREPSRLLLWGFGCFALLAVNSVLLVVDLALIDSIDLSVWRSATNLAGTSLLLAGLVLETTGPGRRR